MKHIYVNLKRFDIARKLGGVNSLAPINIWASTIMEQINRGLSKYKDDDVDFTVFFPEAHLITAADAKPDGLEIAIGCQGVFREDVAVGGNFGAFTTNLTAKAAKSMGCTSVLIGHCEERKNYTDILKAAGIKEYGCINGLLNQSVKRATEAGLNVLYCIGEKAEEQQEWKSVLKEQIETGLEDVDLSKVCIAYEPVWAIGPGKIPPDKPYIEKIAKYIKQIVDGVDVVYGGGLKEANADMLASINEIDGGLIALTRFSGDIGFYPEEYIKIVDLYLD